MPHGTMSRKPSSAVDTFSAKPCIVTHRDRRTPMAATFAARSAPPGSRGSPGQRRGLAWSTQTPTSFGSPSRKLALDAVGEGEGDHHAGEVAHVATDVAAIGVEVEDGVRHELPGPVIRDVAAAAGLVHVDPAARELGPRDEDVLLLRSAPQRDDRLVLQQEERVAHLAADSRLHHALLQGVGVARSARARASGR